jgi:hypothetical protein
LSGSPGVRLRPAAISQVSGVQSVMTSGYGRRTVVSCSRTAFGTGAIVRSTQRSRRARRPRGRPTVQLRVRGSDRVRLGTRTSRPGCASSKRRTATRLRIPGQRRERRAATAVANSVSKVSFSPRLPESNYRAAWSVKVAVWAKGSLLVNVIVSPVATLSSSGPKREFVTSTASPVAEVPDDLAAAVAGTIRAFPRAQGAPPECATQAESSSHSRQRFR